MKYRQRALRKAYNRGYCEGFYKGAHIEGKSFQIVVTHDLQEMPSNPHAIHSDLWKIHERLCTVGNPHDPNGQPYAILLNDPEVAGLLNEALMALTTKAAVL